MFTNQHAREQLRRTGDFICKSNKMLKENGFAGVDPAQVGNAVLLHSFQICCRTFPSQYVRVMSKKYVFDEAEVGDLLTQDKCGELDTTITTCEGEAWTCASRMRKMSAFFDADTYEERKLVWKQDIEKFTASKLSKIDI